MGKWPAGTGGYLVPTVMVTPGAIPATVLRHRACHVIPQLALRGLAGRLD